MSYALAMALKRAHGKEQQRNAMLEGQEEAMEFLCGVKLP